MANYTISATIENTNDFKVNYTLSCVVYNSNGVAIKTLDTISGTINASATENQSIALSLADTEDTIFSYATISTYFSASGYIDSDIVLQNVNKPSSSGFTGTYRIISGLGLETPTDVLFSDSTDFDNLTFEDWTDSLGNIFVKFPTFYRKNVALVNGQVVAFVISNSKEDDEFLPYPCFVRADGTIRDYIYVGKYNISSTSVANSVNASSVSMTIGNARTLCKAVGDGYYLMHVDVKLFLCDLALAISKTVNINTGSGVSADEFMGIQGDLWGWMDGLATNSGYYLYCHDPSKCVDSPTTSTSGYVQLYAQPTGTDYITKLGYNSSYPFINLPTAVGGSDSTYYCDYYRYYSGSHPSHWDVGLSDADDGWWYLYVNNERSNTFSVRLCYMP